MKKILIGFLILLAVGLFAQAPIIYNSTPTLAWDAVTEDSDGNPLDLLPEDTLSYEIYIFDTDDGDITAQPVESLTFLGETVQTEFTLVFPSRKNWACAVRAKIVDGDDNVAVGNFAYTVDPIPVTVNGPFVYAPILIYIPSAVRGLRDTGM